jgi:hypothetical protein
VVAGRAALVAAGVSPAGAGPMRLAWAAAVCTARRPDARGLWHAGFLLLEWIGRPLCCRCVTQLWGAPVGLPGLWLDLSYVQSESRDLRSVVKQLPEPYPPTLHGAWKARHTSQGQVQAGMQGAEWSRRPWASTGSGGAQREQWQRLVQGVYRGRDKCTRSALKKGCHGAAAAKTGLGHGRWVASGPAHHRGLGRWTLGATRWCYHFPSPAPGVLSRSFQVI